MNWTEELPELPGIYKITNKINGKIYVGESGNLLGRMKKYPQESNTRAVIHAIKKYGWSSFKKEVIEVFPSGVSKKVLRTRETFWIKFFRSASWKWGYNEIEDTVDFRGEKVLKSRKYRKDNGLVDNTKARVKGICKEPIYGNDPERSFKSKPVYQLDFSTGEIIQEWPSVRAASVGLSGGVGGAKAIDGVIKGEYGRKSYYGFGWRLVFAGDGYDPNVSRKMSEESRMRISANRKGKCKGKDNYQFGKPHTEERRRKISETKTGVPNPLKRVRVHQIDPSTGEIMETWDSMGEASAGTKTHISSICACVYKRRGQKTAGGFKWELAEEKV